MTFCDHRVSIRIGSCHFELIRILFKRSCDISWGRGGGGNSESLQCVTYYEFRGYNEAYKLAFFILAHFPIMSIIIQSVDHSECIDSVIH